MVSENENHFTSSHEGHERAQNLAKELLAADVIIKEKAFLRYATGSIKNTSSQMFSYLIVKLDLFDPSGKLVGQIGDGIQNFAPGKTWNFEAGIVIGDVVAVRVSGIEGWL